MLNAFCTSMYGQLFKQVSKLTDAEAGICSMTVDEGRTQLIAGDVKGNLYFRSLSNGVLLKKIKAHNAGINTLAFNSNGKLLISSTIDGEIKIFDFARDQIIQSIYSPDYSGMRFVLFSIADGFIYFNGNGMRNFVTSQFQYFFPDHFCRYYSLRLVSNHILRKILRPFW